MKSITVHFADGNKIHTEINGTEETIINYYLDKYFNFGDTETHPQDKMVKAVKVDFHKKLNKE